MTQIFVWVDVLDKKVLVMSWHFPGLDDDKVHWDNTTMTMKFEPTTEGSNTLPTEIRLVSPRCKRYLCPRGI